MKTVYFLTFLAACFLMAGCQSESNKNALTKPPNIIYIMTDQLAYDAMSSTGNTDVHTPAIDKIAANGVSFSQAYTAYPLCVPARTAMMTSRMPHEAGVFVNTRTISDTVFPFETLAPSLVEAGYNTHYIGKWHLTIPKKDTKTHGFQTLEIPGEHGFDSVYAQLATQFLSKKQEKPFFLVVSFVNPHDCCQLARGEDLGKFEGTIAAIPPVEDLPALPENFERPDKEPSMLRQWQKENQERLYPSYHWSEKEFQEYLWGYYRLVEKVDSLIGKVLSQLETSSYADNTLIIFTSDHGDGKSTHRWNQKWSFYDEASRVPFMVSGNPIKRKGITEDKLVSSSLDLLPTIYDYAGIEIPKNILGKSVKSIVENNQEEAWRKFVVSELSYGNWVDKMHIDTFPKARMIRSYNFKYIVYDSGEQKEQLIDMSHDPGEMKNLAMDAEYQEVLKLHRAYLKEWITETNDTFRMPYE